MLGQAPEISETLEWMLQSRQVGEDILVKRLIQEQYARVYCLVSAVLATKESRRCEAITEQIITAVVDKTSSYRGKSSVDAWLLAESITVLSQRRDASWSRGARIASIDPVPGVSRKVLDWYSGLSCETRAAATLYYVFDFSADQVASILNIGEHRLEGLLRDLIQTYPSRLDLHESDDQVEGELQNSLAALWPGIELDDVSKDRIAQRILGERRSRNLRKRNLMYFSEVLLAILALVFVTSLGGIIEMLTPQPTGEVVYETRMVNQIVFVSPTPGPTPTPRPFPEDAVIYEALGEETLLDVAEKVILPAQLLSALNNIPVDQPLEPGQKIMIGFSETRVLWPTSDSPASTPAAPRPTPGPLSIDNDELLIQQRIAGSKHNWRTLWADALVIQYGPAGYFGEPEIRRQQIWIDQPYFFYLLDGENQGEVEYAYSVIGGWQNLLNIQTGEQWSNAGPQEVNYEPELEQILLSGEFRDGFPGEIELVGQEVVAGRESLLFDWFIDGDSKIENGNNDFESRQLKGRYWIDRNLGIILREQKFTGISDEYLFRETIISKIVIDVTIPGRLYDRAQYLQSYYAKDHTGDYTHEPIEVPEDVIVPREVVGTNQYIPPPPGLELGESRLEFLWTNLQRFDREQGTRVDLFADGFFLGNIQFAEPEQLMCTRSPDGTKIAFSSWSTGLDYGFTPLEWLHLKPSPEVFQFDQRLVPYDYAFSNDSQQLAVYACQRLGEQACGLYIINLDSGSSHLLRPVEQGSGILWSPDDRAIALQGSFLKDGNWRLLVLDIRSGNTIHDGIFDWEGFWVSRDSPIHDWGVQYPPLRGGLKLCEHPP